jgi:hypothetical protein
MHRNLFCNLVLVWLGAGQHLLLLLVSSLGLVETQLSMLMLLQKLSWKVKPRLVCVGNALENVKVSISGQAWKVRERKAFRKAHALGELWKKLLAMLLAVSILPNAEAFSVRKVLVKAPQLVLKANGHVGMLAKDLSQGRLEAVGSQLGLLETMHVAETSVGSHVSGTSDLELLMGECTPVICTELESKSFVVSALFLLVNDAWCNEPTTLVGMWKCACMSDCVGTPHGLCNCFVDPKGVRADGDLPFCEFAMGAYAGAARLSSGSHVTAKFCADELVLYALAVEASLSFIPEEESCCNSYAKFVFVWRRQKFCSAVLLKLCGHCMNGEWWRTNAASQQGNSWCCMLCLVPNSVLADAHQSLMMPGHVGWTLQLWLSSVAREPASCRGLSSVTDLRLLCAGNHCGEHLLVFPSQVGAKC